MKITNRAARVMGKLFNINYNVVSFKDWKYALEVEMEHSDITQGNILTTARIVLAHLLEYPDYYQRLRKMEQRADKFWKNKNRNIFN